MFCVHSHYSAIQLSGVDFCSKKDTSQEVEEAVVVATT